MRPPPAATAAVAVARSRRPQPGRRAPRGAHRRAGPVASGGRVARVSRLARAAGRARAPAAHRRRHSAARPATADAGPLRGRHRAAPASCTLRPVRVRLLTDLRPHMRPHCPARPRPARARAPAPALAGTFTVPFGNGTPMGAAGWIAEARRRRDLRLRGRRHALAERRDAARPQRLLLPLQRARPAAQIVAVNVAHGYAKASAATALCTYSFAARPATRCAAAPAARSRTRSRASGANWVELGLYNEGGVADRARDRPCQQRRVRRAASVTLSDPDGAGASGRPGPAGVQAGLTAELQWSASDPESGAPSVAYAIDGGARVGTPRAGLLVALRHGRQRRRATLDLQRPRRRAALGDGLLPVLRRCASGRTARSPSRVDRTAPARPQIHVVPDAAAAAGRLVGSRARSRCRSRPATARRRRQLAPARLRPIGRARRTTRPPAGALSARGRARVGALDGGGSTASKSSNATPPATARRRRARRCAGTALRRPCPPTPRRRRSDRWPRATVRT